MVNNLGLITSSDTANPRWWESRAKALQTAWSPRQIAMADWYKILLLDNTIKRPGLESFIGNDPRTSFNLAIHILTHSFLRHELVEIDDFSTKNKNASDQLQAQIADWWRREDSRNRSRGRKPWLFEFCQFMLATGWYAIFADPDLTQAEIWNPATVYQDFADDTGILEVVHVLPMSRHKAAVRAQQNGWILPDRDRHMWDMLMDWVRTPNQRITWYNHFLMSEGNVVNTVYVSDGVFLKEPMEERDLPRIPVFTGPVGGMPDRGAILDDESWYKHLGEGWPAVAEELIANFNKHFTYTQQLLRDTAQARWKVKTQGNLTVTKEQLEVRGGVFHMKPEEDITSIDGSTIPLEVSTQQSSMEGMMQRSFFPYSMYGTLPGQMSTLLMSQVSGAAQHVLGGYSDALVTAMSDVDNFWLNYLREQNVKPFNKALPANLPTELEVLVRHNISVPGDTVARATTSRMLNPNFTLPETRIMELMWPEIDNPDAEIARARGSKAMMDPRFTNIDLSLALRERADELRDAGDSDFADILDAQVDQLVSGVTQQPPNPQSQSTNGVTPAPSVLPVNERGDRR